MTDPAEHHVGDALAIQVARLDERTLALQRDVGEVRTEVLFNVAMRLPR